ncbi:glycosyltransferase family 2 protein [Fontivita pretiosa]|uniref:glycosyltransferase family 2 protein n=1 Tax=Fontivita pretiosa TaxID=2989684 RepID=UPI003D17A039
MSSPRVSIGVPVFNGQKYLRFTLDSLLAQTFSDIEIIVTDNCSTDATPQIVAEYAARDPRIRYIRNPTNLGPARNYRVSMDLARGEYFKWNPADDVCAPDFIEKCVKVLDADPSVVMVYPRTNLIDAQGQVFAQYDYERDFDHPSPAVRLWRMMTVDHRVHGGHELYGVIRTAELRKTPGMLSHVRGDSVLLARFALLGRLRRIEEYLFFNRDHSDRSSKYQDRAHVRQGSRLARYLGYGPLPAAEWWDPRLRGRIVWPEWRVWREYLRAVRETDLPWGQKLACYGAFALYTIRHTPKLARDVLIAAEQFINRLIHKPNPTDSSDRRGVIA